MRRIPLLLVVMAGASRCSCPARPSQRPRGQPRARPTAALPTIGGTAQQGQTLTATSGSWDGTTPITYTYQWQRCNSSGSSCGSIGSATNQNYVASNGDVGRTIRVAGDGHERRRHEPGALRRDRRDRRARQRSGEHEAAGSVRDGAGRPDGHRRRRQLVGPEADHVHATSGRPAPPPAVCTDIAGATGIELSASARARSARSLRATVTATNSAGKTSAFSNLTAVVLAKASAPVEHEPAGDLRLGARSGRRFRPRPAPGRASRRTAVRLPVEPL